MSDTPSRSELEGTLAATREELTDAIDAKDRANSSERSALRIAMAAPVVAGLFSLGVAAINDAEPVVTNCIQQRNQAVASVERTDVWTTLPEDSTSEEECNINSYVVDWQAENPS